MYIKLIFNYINKSVENYLKNYIKLLENLPVSIYNITEKIQISVRKNGGKKWQQKKKIFGYY